MKFFDNDLPPLFVPLVKLEPGADSVVGFVP